MSDVIELIRGAIAPAATEEARAAGASACRALLAALDPSPSPPLVAPEVVPQLVAVLKTMNVDQLLDTAIAKLRTLEAAKPAPTAVAPVSRRLVIPLVPVPT